MSDTPPPLRYRRIPGAGRRIDGVLALDSPRNTLWLGPDHLLSLNQYWTSEEYKRFYFRDIQAITVHRNKRSATWNLVLSSLAVLTAMLFLALIFDADDSSSRLAWIIGGVILVGLFVLLLIVNATKGPTCVTRLHTAVQTENLPALGRVPKALRALGLLQPFIQETQGALTPEAIRQSMASRPEPSGARSAGQAAPLPRGFRPPEAAAAVAAPAKVGVHLALYTTLLLASAMQLVEHFAVRLSGLMLAGLVIDFVVVGLAFAALIRQRGRNVSAALRKLTVATFVGVLLMMFTVGGYVYVGQVMSAVEHPGRIIPQRTLRSLPGFTTTALVGAILGAVVGTTGLILAGQQRARKAPVAVSTPTPSGAPPLPEPLPPSGPDEATRREFPPSDTL